MLSLAGEIPEAIELSRALAKPGANLAQLKPILKALEDQNPESIRLMICSYFSKVFLGAKDGSTAEEQALAILDAFSQPMNSQDKLTPVILAVGRLLR